MAVFHKIKFFSDIDEREATQDAIIVRPEQSDKLGRIIPARFDTALVRMGDGNKIRGNAKLFASLESDSYYSVHLDFRVARVRVLFALPDSTQRELFQDRLDLLDHARGRLAYVEWFTKFTAQPDQDFRMYKVSKPHNVRGETEFGIVPVSDIVRSAHLLPCFDASVPPDWDSDNVLDKCSRFFLNSFKDRSTHFCIY